jgi:hypothetical protein
MANTSVSLVGLDFNTIKTNLKNFLKTNTAFKDMDFEGSNINVLLDVLSYNTYLNSYYTNMIASEMFLDTAQLRDSIVSHAKELNYLPRSFVSAKASVNVAITPVSAAVTSIVIPKYTSFTSRVGSNTFSFTTNETLVVTESNNGAFSASLDIFEGIAVSETFVVDRSNTVQRFVLSNPTVDVDSINITVYEDSGQTELDYTQATTLVGLANTSQIFFVQAAENFQYEILFGDGVYGRQPKNGSSAVIKYRASSGEAPNGASVFSSDGAIDGHSNVSVTTITSASGGVQAENNESIRFNAPRRFQAQDRAITPSDYEILLKTRFPEIQAISVYGGEEATPPQYGRVYISVDTANAEGVSVVSKNNYKDYIQQRSPLTIGVEFIDPEFTYVDVQTNVKYNTSRTSKTTSDISSAVKAAISLYSLNNIEDFNSTLYYSNLIKNIDSSDASILGNDTTLRLIKRIQPSLNVNQEIDIDFQNELDIDPFLRAESTDVSYGYTISSTSFTYSNTTCILIDDSLGNIFIATKDLSTVRVLIKIGTVNYTTGFIQLTNFNISAYQGTYIKIFARAKNKDLVSRRNSILTIDLNDVSVTATGVKQ